MTTGGPSEQGTAERDLPVVSTLIVAGWTGRDRETVQHHIDELSRLGVSPPSSVPLFYRASSQLLGAHDRIDVVGANTSGEVEPMIVRIDDRDWLGVASDHTDRELESHSVALSKQICAKPCAPRLWPLDRVRDRLDSLQLRSWICETETGSRSDWLLYQEGTLAGITPLSELIEQSSCFGPGNPAVTAMLCGTLPAIGGVRPSARFRFELHDAETGRTLRHEYRVRELAHIE